MWCANGGDAELQNWFAFIAFLPIFFIFAFHYGDTLVGYEKYLCNIHLHKSLNAFLNMCEWPIDAGNWIEIYVSIKSISIYSRKYGRNPHSTPFQSNGMLGNFSWYQIKKIRLPPCQLIQFETKNQIKLMLISGGIEDHPLIQSFASTSECVHRICMVLGLEISHIMN